MKLFFILKSKRGATLVEMIVSLVLLCLAIIMICSVLGPAARMTARMKNLNNVQIITDSVLEVIRDKLEDAQGYVKLYELGKDEEIIGNTGSGTVGSIAEFKDPDGYAVIISAKGCNPTTLKRSGDTVGTIDGIDSGYVIMRYYRYRSADNSYNFRDNGEYIAHAYSESFPKAFYAGYKVNLDFEVIESSIRVTVSVTDSAEEIAYSDSVNVNLRYSPKIMTGITATE